LLLLAIGLLELGLFAARQLLGQASMQTDSNMGTSNGQPARGGSYLAGLGLYTVLFTISSAIVYLEQARIVGAAYRDPAARTAFFAHIDLLVNLVGLVLQLTLTGRLMTTLGVGWTAALLPIATLAGFVGLVLRPTLTVLLWFQVARRALDYAVARPSREVMYTVVRRGAKYQAKSFIDTAVYRSGDVMGAWAYGLLATLSAASGWLIVLVALVTVPWTMLSLWLGRQQRSLSRNVSGEV
jgi:AAA family ATP:ADP antiporter